MSRRTRVPDEEAAVPPHADASGEPEAAARTGGLDSAVVSEGPEPEAADGVEVDDAPAAGPSAGRGTVASDEDEVASGPDDTEGVEDRGVDDEEDDPAAANAAEAPSTSGSDGVGSGTQAAVGVTLPVTVSGNGISVVGDSSSSDSSAAPAAAPAPSVDVSTSGLAGALSGTQALVSVDDGGAVWLRMRGISVAGFAVPDLVLGQLLPTLRFLIPLPPLPYGLRITGLEPTGEGLVVHGAARAVVFRRPVQAS